jgi:hypothetical protein
MFEFVVDKSLRISYHMTDPGGLIHFVCKIYKCKFEMASHIMFECHYSSRIWTVVASKLPCPPFRQNLGSGRQTILQYWHAISRSHLDSERDKNHCHDYFEELCKETNAGVFNNKS